jgi:O-antigen/teichoic acid export membrane protein
VELLLGSQWVDVIPLVRPLVLAGILQSVSQFSYSLFFAKKEYGVLNLHLVTAFILMAWLIIWWGGQAHLQGAVMGILVSRAVTLPLIVIGIIRATRKS